MTQLVKLDSALVVKKVRVAIKNLEDSELKEREIREERFKKELEWYNSLPFWKRLFTERPTRSLGYLEMPFFDEFGLHNILELCQKGESVYLDYESVALIELHLGESL